MEGVSTVVSRCKVTGYAMAESPSLTGPVYIRRLRWYGMRACSGLLGFIVLLDNRSGMDINRRKGESSFALV